MADGDSVRIGQNNLGSTQTLLQATVNAPDPVFLVQVGGGSSGDAISGRAGPGIGVVGASRLGGRPGVFGSSDGSIFGGVMGSSPAIGIRGHGSTGVVGQGVVTGIAGLAFGPSGVGGRGDVTDQLGQDAGGAGLIGTTQASAGVVGISDTGVGVRGTSTRAAGITGIPSSQYEGSGAGKGSLAMTVSVKELLLGIHCLAEISKDVDGEIRVLDADLRTCRNPGCDSLTLVTNLRLNLHPASCDSSLGMVLDGLIRSWDLTTVFAGPSEVLRGVHEGDLYWSSSGGGTIRGTLEGITNAGIVRLPPLSDCEPCDQVGLLTGRLFATGSNIPAIPVPDFDVQAVYRLAWDPTATIGATAPVTGTIEGVILMPCQ